MNFAWQLIAIAFLYDINERLELVLSQSVMRENGTLTWIISDHLGSTTALANEDGSLKTLMRYTAFEVFHDATCILFPFPLRGTQLAPIH